MHASSEVKTPFEVLEWVFHRSSLGSSEGRCCHGCYYPIKLWYLVPSLFWLGNNNHSNGKPRNYTRKNITCLIKVDIMLEHGCAGQLNQCCYQAWTSLIFHQPLFMLDTSCLFKVDEPSCLIKHDASSLFKHDIIKLVLAWAFFPV